MIRRRFSSFAWNDCNRVKRFWTRKALSGILLTLFLKIPIPIEFHFGQNRTGISIMESYRNKILESSRNKNYMEIKVLGRRIFKQLNG